MSLFTFCHLCTKLRAFFSFCYNQHYWDVIASAVSRCCPRCWLFIIVYYSFKYVHVLLYWYMIVAFCQLFPDDYMNMNEYRSLGW